MSAGGMGCRFFLRAFHFKGRPIKVPPLKAVDSSLLEEIARRWEGRVPKLGAAPVVLSAADRTFTQAVRWRRSRLSP